MKAVILLSHSLLASIFVMPGCGKSPADLPGSNSKNAPLVVPQQLAVGPRVGMLAPEITGQDLNGVPFKLSEYRGKVVLLDFWGHW